MRPGKCEIAFRTEAPVRVTHLATTTSQYEAQGLAPLVARTSDVVNLLVGGEFISFNCLQPRWHVTCSQVQYRVGPVQSYSSRPTSIPLERRVSSMAITRPVPMERRSPEGPRARNEFHFHLRSLVRDDCAPKPSISF